MTRDPSWQSASDCDRRTFRDMLGSFMTGVTVVATTADDGSARAFTANSFTSVSLDPPLILVCLAKSSSNCGVFEGANQFSVSILGEWQREISNVFARPGPAKDDALKALPVDGAPFVEGALSIMQCRRREVVDAGDHVILLGEVDKFASAVGQPLGYFKGGYVSFGLAEQQLERVAAPLVVGGLLDIEGKVLLCRRPGSPYWEIPFKSAAQGEPHSELLETLFKSLGVSAQSSFLYSLFQEEGDRYTKLVFSMEMTDPGVPLSPPQGIEVRLFEEAEQPWTLVKGSMIEGLLHRYFRERAVGTFGTYYDTRDGGRISPVGKDSTHWTQWLKTPL